jgi:Flp pilus assembly pilin Flp
VTGGSLTGWIFPIRQNKANLNTRSRQMNFLRTFWQEEQGQDLIEYTLLMAFVALASAALFIGAGGSIKGIWSVTNSQLAAASTSAS